MVFDEMPNPFLLSILNTGTVVSNSGTRLLHSLFRYGISFKIFGL
ncbi:hypothetical protein M6B38_305785 [Iris pallida]|uniref:Uncharacterized protein n=1 Tax=Iris pallida TaxID=29817 RepID=A0AAX6HLN2_IRIPA|nr:hypothetical protein M6B38_305785 [Iris pallida]